MDHTDHINSTNAGASDVGSSMPGGGSPTIVYVVKPRNVTKKLGRPKKNTPEMTKEKKHEYYVKYYAANKDKYNRGRKTRGADQAKTDC
jgi:hypothetical protein